MLCTKCYKRSIEPARLAAKLLTCYECALNVPRKKGMVSYAHKTAGSIDIMHPATYAVAKKVFARRAGKQCNLGKSMNGAAQTTIYHD